MNSEKDYYQLYLKYKRKYLAEKKRQAGGGNTWYKYKLPTVNAWFIYETKIGKSICAIKSGIPDVEIINIYISNSDIITKNIKIMTDAMKKLYPTSMIYCVPKTASIIPEPASIIPEPESIYNEPNAYSNLPEDYHGKIYSINASDPNAPPYDVEVLNINCKECGLNNVDPCIVVKRILPIGVSDRDEFCITIKKFIEERKAQALYAQVKKNRS